MCLEPADKPPCVPSDERPANIFGSEEAAYATAAANTLEHLLTEQESGEEEEEEDEEEREQDIKKARVFYEHSLRRLAREFPDLQVPVTQLVAGLHAREQCTRPCPCGVGDIPRWPWVLSTSSLGFCPEAQTVDPPIVRGDMVLGKFSETTEPKRSTHAKDVHKLPGTHMNTRL